MPCLQRVPLCLSDSISSRVPTIKNNFNSSASGCFQKPNIGHVSIRSTSTWTPFSTVREKADGKGIYARIMIRGLCAHNDREILRAGHLMNHIIVIEILMKFLWHLTSILMTSILMTKILMTSILMTLIIMTKLLMTSILILMTFQWCFDDILMTSHFPDSWLIHPN